MLKLNEHRDIHIMFMERRINEYLQISCSWTGATNEYLQARFDWLKPPFFYITDCSKAVLLMRFSVLLFLMSVSVVFSPSISLDF